MIHPGIEQDAFRSRSLARINVGADADVAVTIDWGFACHDKNLKKPLTAKTLGSPEKYWCLSVQCWQWVESKIPLMFVGIADAQKR
jgi:hypothetical protein